MAITDNVRKALADATPLYAAAGTVDLAAQKLREVQPLIERLRDEAPQRFERVRSNADPKAVQERVVRQAKDVQARLTEAFGGGRVDLRKFREDAQDFAMQQVGRVAEYAVRAGETYHGLADRGRGAVRIWRGEGDDRPSPTPTFRPATPPEAADRPADRNSAAANGSERPGGKPGGKRTAQGK